MPKIAPQSLVDQLNALLSQDNGSLIRHLAEATPHVSARTWQAWQSLHQLQEHRQARVHLMIDMLRTDLDVQPRTVDFTQDVGFAHFLTLDAILPQITVELTQTKAGFMSLLPTSIARLDNKIQQVVALCDEDLAAIDQAMQMIKSTPSTLS